MSSREDILARIRGVRQTVAVEYAAIPRHYRSEGELASEQRLKLLCDRLEDYGCGLEICARNEIAQSIERILQERGKTKLLATADIPREWLPRDFPDGSSLTFAELDLLDGVITRCALAIAYTGTIVLRHDSQTGPRAVTLIPDYHLCILFEEQIVELVPEAIRRMVAFAPAPVTTISGPSATSDIEMTRIQGVHGPRTLDVLVVK